MRMLVGCILGLLLYRDGFGDGKAGKMMVGNDGTGWNCGTGCGGMEAAMRIDTCQPYSNPNLYSQNPNKFYVT